MTDRDLPSFTPKPMSFLFYKRGQNPWEGNVLERDELLTSEGLINDNY